MRGADALSEPGLASLTQADREFAEAVINGLSKPRKSLPCRYFYDQRGSELFEQITRLPEYYPTRAETEILAAHAAEMADGTGDDSILVEFGSGSSRKTEILLRALPRLRAYIPIDVSESALSDARRRLSGRFPGLDVRPLRADFSVPVPLPPDLAGCGKLGFFPGSTIGNLTPAEAGQLLGNFRTMLAPGGRLLVGADLLKDKQILQLAYDDPAGVTAAFNLNLLERINRTFGPVFEVGTFRHRAAFNEQAGRIEMHLVSERDQTVELLGHRFRFRKGEAIHTENSHKFTIPQFREIAAASGWEPRRVWTDAAKFFSVHELTS